MPKILKYLQSKKMKEPVSEDYCPTDKPPSATLPCTSSYVLALIVLYNFFFSAVNSATLSKSSFFSTECLALCFGEEPFRHYVQFTPNAYDSASRDVVT